MQGEGQRIGSAETCVWLVQQIGSIEERGIEIPIGVGRTDSSARQGERAIAVGELVGEVLGRSIQGQGAPESRHHEIGNGTPRIAGIRGVIDIGRGDCAGDRGCRCVFTNSPGSAGKRDRGGVIHRCDRQCDGPAGRLGRGCDPILAITPIANSQRQGRSAGRRLRCQVVVVGIGCWDVLERSQQGVQVGQGAVHRDRSAGTGESGPSAVRRRSR